MSLPGAQPGEQPGVLVQAGVQCRTVGDGQRAGQPPQPHDRAVLVRQQIQVEVEIGDVAGVVDLAVQRDEPPTSDMVRIDGDRMRGVRLVDVDQQDMTRIGLDVIEVRHFRRAGVPHPATLADAGAGVLVPPKAT